MPLPTHATPTVHLNGDNGWELMHQHTLALATLRQLRKDISAAAPHMRNYPANQAQGMQDALLYGSWLNQLDQMALAMEATREHLADQER